MPSVFLGFFSLTSLETAPSSRAISGPATAARGSDPAFTQKRKGKERKGKEKKYARRSGRSHRYLFKALLHVSSRIPSSECRLKGRFSWKSSGPFPGWGSAKKTLSRALNKPDDALNTYNILDIYCTEGANTYTHAHFERRYLRVTCRVELNWISFSSALSVNLYSADTTKAQ